MIYDNEKATLGGRAVELRNVGFGYALESNRIREEQDSWAATKYICAMSAHWADTGERVFADVAAIDAWPMRDSMDLIDLINKAGKVNSLREQGTSLANGALKDEAAPRPSH
jgi:hypothetical protein